MKIILTGEPKSTNNIYKSHCRFGFPTVYMSTTGKDLKKDYQKQLVAQWRKQPIEEDITLTMRIFFGRKGKHDIDNFNKIIWDSLTGIVWKDDSQIVELHIYKDFDKKNPRVELDIECI